MASPAFPEPPSEIPATSLAEADAILEGLSAHKKSWVETSLARRAELLRACMVTTLEASEGWAKAGTQAKGGHPGSGVEGEVMLGGPVVTMRTLRLLAESLETLQKGKEPWHGPVKSHHGQTVVNVFPTNTWEKLVFVGISGEIWLEPGKEATQAALYKEKAEESSGQGALSLVLGAGNVSSIGPGDAVFKLFQEDEVVVVKTNPVNAYVGPFWEQALQPLVDEGVLAFVYGGAEVGAHMAHHPLVDTIHITGSDRTHDAIVWGGSRDEQQRRKAAGEPILTKKITSELGCVTPVLVVPGPWSDSDLHFQAEQIASMVAHNGSFNCNSAKVVLLPKGWDLRDRFVQKIREALAHAAPRKAYYPGAQQRYQAFCDQYPGAIPLAERTDDVVPWTVLPDVPAEKGEYALTNEAFCGILAEVDVEAATAEEYLVEAVRFANEEVWGTLSCMMLVHPKTQKQHPELVEQAIANLRYGGVGVNIWAGVIFGVVATTWGAYPGHPLDNIESGRGVVHNPFMLDHPQKSVLRAPFRMAPKPVWFHDHKNLPEVSRKVLNMEASGSLWKIPGLAMAALKG